MKVNKLQKCSLFIAIAILLTLIGCGQKSNYDWAINFVVWDGHLYEAIQQEVEIVDNRLAEVEKYVQKEGIYTGVFSNKYPKGTGLYKISGVDIKEAIAIEISEGKYIRAVNKGEYK